MMAASACFELWGAGPLASAAWRASSTEEGTSQEGVGVMIQGVAVVGVEVAAAEVAAEGEEVSLGCAGGDRSTQQPTAYMPHTHCYCCANCLWEYNNNVMQQLMRFVNKPLCACATLCRAVPCAHAGGGGGPGGGGGGEQAAPPQKHLALAGSCN